MLFELSTRLNPVYFVKREDGRGHARSPINHYEFPIRAAENGGYFRRFGPGRNFMVPERFSAVLCRVARYAATVRDLTIENCETPEIFYRCPVTKVKFIKGSARTVPAPIADRVPQLRPLSEGRALIMITGACARTHARMFDGN